MENQMKRLTWTRNCLCILGHAIQLTVLCVSLSGALPSGKYISPTCSQARVFEQGCCHNSGDNLIKH